MDKLLPPSTMESVSEFIVSPYKICVSVLIQVFAEHRRSQANQREIGSFCCLTLQLIQGLDVSYQQLLKIIEPTTMTATKLSPFVYDKFKEKLEEIADEGLTCL